MEGKKIVDGRGEVVLLLGAWWCAEGLEARIGGSAGSRDWLDLP